MLWLDCRLSRQSTKLLFDQTTVDVMSHCQCSEYTDAHVCLDFYVSE